MNFLYSFILVTSTLCVHGLTIPGSENYFILDGQVIYPGGPQISIEPDSRLIIELQDISVTHDLTTTLAQHINKAVVFPIIFSITYAWNQVIHGHVHVLNAKIINKHDEILFVNEQRIEVKLLGAGRTKFIDIPVFPFQYHDLVPAIKLLQWPELVGKDGNAAVDIIKQQTGYQQVFVVTDGTQVTKDLRYDRVCVYVDQDGKVAHVPKTA